MINPIEKAYRTIDDVLMYGANKAVYAWNWTTGGTKADLANLLCDSWVILSSLGLMSRIPKAAVAGVPITILGGHITQKQYTKIDELEQKSIEDELKHPIVEMGKEVCRVFGLNKLVLSSILSYWSVKSFKDYKPQEGIEEAMMGMGWCMFGAADYVIRTDYLPPRKNVLSRAKDKLIEIIQTYKNRPELIPVPAK